MYSYMGTNHPDDITPPTRRNRPQQSVPSTEAQPLGDAEASTRGNIDENLQQPVEGTPLVSLNDHPTGTYDFF